MPYFCVVQIDIDLKVKESEKHSNFSRDRRLIFRTKMAPAQTDADKFYKSDTVCVE